MGSKSASVYFRMLFVTSVWIEFMKLVSDMPESKSTHFHSQTLRYCTLPIQHNKHIIQTTRIVLVNDGVSFVANDAGERAANFHL